MIDQSRRWFVEYGLTTVDTDQAVPKLSAYRNQPFPTFNYTKSWHVESSLFQNVDGQRNGKEFR